MLAGLRSRCTTPRRCAADVVAVPVGVYDRVHGLVGPAPHRGDGFSADGVAAGVARFAHFLRDFEFDGETVTIPAGDIWRALPADRLIIDDDVDTCTLLSSYLNRNGFETDIAYSGTKGLQKFKSGHFDVIL